MSSPILKYLQWAVYLIAVYIIVCAFVEDSAINRAYNALEQQDGWKVETFADVEVKDSRRMYFVEGKLMHWAVLGRELPEQINFWIVDESRVTVYLYDIPSLKFNLKAGKFLWPFNKPDFKEKIVFEADNGQKIIFTRTSQ